MKSFDVLGLNNNLMSKIKFLGLSEPTPIQYQAIPHILNGKDIMGLAQTGTGKTAAFVLPISHELMKIKEKRSPKSVRALILAPTRELAKQIQDVTKSFVKGTPLRTGMVVGGLSINPQINKLNKGFDILVATPGRLIDLINRKAITLEFTKFLVLDEADQMLDLGFIHSLREISKFLPEQKQTMLFSATMPKLMSEIAATYLTAPIRIEVSQAGKIADGIKQSVHFVIQGDKSNLLERLLLENKTKRALVFMRTKYTAEKLMKFLVSRGFQADSIHGNKSQGQRDRALQGFKTGTIRVLVATDVAARGIDIPAVEFVFNYDLPNVVENYVHRIGRTARAGASGNAISFCSSVEMKDFIDIERKLNLRIAIAGGERWEKITDGISKKKHSTKRNLRKNNRKKSISFNKNITEDFDALEKSQTKRRKKKRRSGVRIKKKAI